MTLAAAIDGWDWFAIASGIIALASALWARVQAQAAREQAQAAREQVAVSKKQVEVAEEANRITIQAFAEQRAARLPSIKITVLLRGGSLELTVVNTGETITHIHAFYILHANGEKSTTERYAGGVTNAVAIQNGLQSGQMFKRQYAHFVTDPKTRSSREAGADSWKDAVAAVVEVNNKVFRCERADWVISN